MHIYSKIIVIVITFSHKICFVEREYHNNRVYDILN